MEPRYNEDLGTMKITLLYQISHIRVKKERNIKRWDQQNYLVIRTKVKTTHTFCTHSAPILHGYYCGLGNENCGGMSQLQPEQKAHCQPSRGLIIRSECRSSSFTDECILNEKLITTCWNCSSIQRQLSAC